MTSTDLLLDAFERIRDAVQPAVNGLSPDELSFRPDDESNSIAWLVWHLTRIQGDHVAGLADGEQVWTAQGWAERFALPLDPSDTGYGRDPDMVAAVTADASRCSATSRASMARSWSSCAPRGNRTSHVWWTEAGTHP